MSLQGFPMKTKTFQRVANLSRQIHKINLEFLETKILDRAVVMNITVGPVRPGQSDVARPPQMEQHRTEHNEATKRTSERTSERTSDLSTTPFRLFSMHERCKHQNFGLYYMLSLKTMDHVELVRGFDPSEPDWVTTFAGKFNVTQGFSKPSCRHKIASDRNLDTGKADACIPNRLEDQLRLFGTSKHNARSLSTNSTQ